MGKLRNNAGIICVWIGSKKMSTEMKGKFYADLLYVTLSNFSHLASLFVQKLNCSESEYEGHFKICFCSS
jgi:hypothetical protein